ncbi:metalloproteinase inhibitor 4-like [Oculina patagonica]
MNSIICCVAVLFSAVTMAYTTDEEARSEKAYYLRHPQERFCLADFAVRAIVLPGNQTTEGYKLNRVYDLKILKVYKGRDKLHNRTEDIRANGENFTANGEIGFFAKAYTVAVALKSSIKYLLAGSIKMEKIQLNSGSWIQPWPKVTLAQRAGIRGIYAQNCQCQITPCFGIPGCDQLLKGCNVYQYELHEFYHGCEWLYSYCLKNSEATACSWHETAAYKNCMNPGLP